ncbi:MAG: hypothetical protein IPM50_02255 [Acidobacteriota bacterium]|nr:MAG: hypothetical protein IPM50_02255 [Acidobacteriota bacterium]
MKTFQVILLLIVLLSGIPLVSAQTSPKKPSKSKPIRATVTVIGSRDVDAPRLPDESKWSEFSIPEHGLMILFPGENDNINDSEVGPVQTFSVSTQEASYTLAIRSVGLPIDQREIQAFLDEAIDNAFDPASTKYLFRRPIPYEGHIGREFAFLEKGRRTEFRVYLLDGKLVIISVAVTQKNYDAGFDKWIQKFFESLIVKTHKVEA